MVTIKEGIINEPEISASSHPGMIIEVSEDELNPLKDLSKTECYAKGLHDGLMQIKQIVENAKRARESTSWPNHGFVFNNLVAEIEANIAQYNFKEEEK